MAYDVEHVLISWGGKLMGGETWSCSLRCAEQADAGFGTHVPPQESVDEWLHGAIKDAVLAFHTRATTRIHTAALLQWVKANRIGAGGLYMDPATNEHVFADTAGGAGNTIPPFPNQCTVAVSLTTGLSRGAAHRGRFYLPSPSVTLDATTGGITVAHQTNIRDSCKTFLEAIADTPLIDAPNSLTPCVMSQKPGNETHHIITGVEVGRIVDTQRRRRRSLTEGYLGVALDLGAA